MEQKIGTDVTQVYREGVELGKLAESLGFDSIWKVEHHFSSIEHAPSSGIQHSVCPDPVTVLGAISTVTQTIGLATGIIALPFHHPLLVADSIATLDALSAGRAIFGVGMGYRKYQFEALQIPIEEKKARFWDTLDAAVSALSEREASYSGQYFSYDGVTILPEPVQKPHPPVWVATSSGEFDMVEGAGARGHNAMTSIWPTIDDIRELSSSHAKANSDAGRDTADHSLFGAIRIMFVTDKHGDAAEILRPFVDALLADNKKFRPTDAPDLFTYGDPSYCREKVTEFEEAGVDKLIVYGPFGGMPLDVARHSLELFSEQIMPAFV